MKGKFFKAIIIGLLVALVALPTNLMYMNALTNNTQVEEVTVSEIETAPSDLDQNLLNSTNNAANILAEDKSSAAALASASSFTTLDAWLARNRTLSAWAALQNLMSTPDRINWLFSGDSITQGVFYSKDIETM